MGEASNNDQNSVAEKQGLGSSMGSDNMATLKLGPVAKLVFRVGIAFVKCERVNNSISPEGCFYGAPNAVKTMSSLEGCQPRGKNNQLCLEALPMALGPGLFVYSEAMCSFRKHNLSTIRETLGAQLLGKPFKKLRI